MPNVITKSLYLNGLQCPKLLWIMCNDKEKIPEADEALKHIFEQGHQVGELAKTLFPKGIEIKGDYWELEDSDKKSRIALKLRKPLFEAGFIAYDGKIYSRADILLPAGKNEWDIIEVKSSTKVDETNIHDVAFQRYCYEKAGLKIRKCFLMHINKEYIRKGKIDAKKLLQKEDITKEVDEAMKDIKQRIDAMLEIMSLKKCPEIKISQECNDCSLQDYCWKHIPSHSVFDLYYGGKKSFELYDLGVVNFEDIPENFKLSEKQMIQHHCAKAKTVHVHKEEIKKFLKTLKYPLYFLDFETYCTAIPLYDKTTPYQNIPFQFSLHTVKNEKSKPEHHSFIAEGEKDPRKEFIDTLKPLLGNKGSIIIYNQSFEQGVLEGLVEIFPKYQGWLKQITERMADLLAPFKNFYYYNPKQQGSCSLKAVLPALTGLSYEKMEISAGANASLQYLYMTHRDSEGKKPSKDEAAKICKALEEYCGLDSGGMIEIVKRLEELSG